MPTFGTVCDGIGCGHLGFVQAGFACAWSFEIEPFPSAVLAYRFPDVTNHGDMLKCAGMVKAGEIEAPDVFIGGTPCQAFSVAGKRKGLKDARGNLSLTFCGIADAIDDVRGRDGKQPCVVLWENVPGVLSDSGNAFGCFLGELSGAGCQLVPPGGRWRNAGCVFGPKRTVAWRVLDSQFFGVAQRRRRVFVVASAGDGFRPEEVLFEREGVRRDSAPSREARQTAPTIPARSTAGGGLGTDFDCDGGLQVAGTMKACKDSGGWSNSADHAAAGYMVPVVTICAATGQAGAETGAETGADMGPTLNCNPSLCSGTRGTGGIAASNQELFSQRGSGLVPVRIVTCAEVSTVDAKNNVDRGDASHFDRLICEHVGIPDICGCLSDGAHNGGGLNGQDAYTGRIIPVQTYDMRGNGDGETVGTLTGDHAGRPTDYTPVVCCSAEITGPLVSGHSPKGHGCAGVNSQAVEAGHVIAIQERACAPDINCGPGGKGYKADGTAYTLEARNKVQAVAICDVIHGDKSCNGKGWNDDGSAYTLDTMATQGVAIAFERRFVRTSGGQPSIDLQPCLRADANSGDGAPCVAFVQNTRDTGLFAVSVDQYNGALSDAQPTLGSNCGMSTGRNGVMELTSGTEHDTLMLQGLSERINNANATQADADSILRLLRKTHGEEAYVEWENSIIASLQPSEILRQALHGAGMDAEGFAIDDPEERKVEGDKKEAARAVRDLRKSKCAGCPPQGQGHKQQLAREPSAGLPLLPQQDSPEAQAVPGVWQTAEGAWVLREALSAVQKVRRPADVQAQPAHQGMSVRRLTPRCCERLQGLPDDWTLIPWRGKPAADCPDGPRYKGIGNGQTVNVMRWLAERIKKAIAV